MVLCDISVGPRCGGLLNQWPDFSTATGGSVSPTSCQVLGRESGIYGSAGESKVTKSSCVCFERFRLALSVFIASDGIYDDNNLFFCNPNRYQLSYARDLFRGFFKGRNENRCHTFVLTTRPVAGGPLSINTNIKSASSSTVICYDDLASPMVQYSAISQPLAPGSHPIRRAAHRCSNTFQVG
jgi:hypothetical protein